jgi:AcrR family transcriptional regulator
MKLFWDRGYEGTTFDDLIGVMNIGPSSFYHEFGSKEQMYREAVDYYLNVCLVFFPRALSTHRDTRAAFEALIEESAAFLTSDASPAGCMISLAGTHLPPHLRSVADFTKGVRKLSEQALVGRLRKGASDGDLPPETNVKELATYFGAVLCGMAVQARDGASRKQLLAIGRVALCGPGRQHLVSSQPAKRFPTALSSDSPAEQRKSRFRAAGDQRCRSGSAPAPPQQC